MWSLLINLLCRDPLGIKTLNLCQLIFLRSRQEDIITKPLLMRVVSSGVLILIGTMYVFLHEMEDGEVSHRDLTMTFTTFVMFDMFNALSCRHNTRPVFELPWNSNPAFLVAFFLSILGQLLVIYSPLLQIVFRTVPLSFEDLFFVVSLASSVVVIDFVRKKYFPSMFTEGLPLRISSVGKMDKPSDRSEKAGVFMV